MKVKFLYLDDVDGRGIYHGLAQFNPRSPGRSCAITVILCFGDKTYAHARPVIPAPTMVMFCAFDILMMSFGLWW